MRGTGIAALKLDKYTDVFAETVNPRYKRTAVITINILA